MDALFLLIFLKDKFIDLVAICYCCPAQLQC